MLKATLALGMLLISSMSFAAYECDVIFGSGDDSVTVFYGHKESIIVDLDGAPSIGTLENKFVEMYERTNKPQTNLAPHKFYSLEVATQDDENVIVYVLLGNSLNQVKAGFFEVRTGAVASKDSKIIRMSTDRKSDETIAVNCKKLDK